MGLIALLGLWVYRIFSKFGKNSVIISSNILCSFPQFSDSSHMYIMLPEVVPPPRHWCFFFFYAFFPPSLHRFLLSFTFFLLFTFWFSFSIHSLFHFFFFYYYVSLVFQFFILDHFNCYDLTVTNPFLLYCLNCLSKIPNTVFFISDNVFSFLEVQFRSF